MLTSLGENPGSMAAIAADPSEVAKLISQHSQVKAVNLNGPRQTVVAGPVESIDTLVSEAQSKGLQARRLAVAGAFHTEKVAAAVEPLTSAVAAQLGAAPALPVYSNLDAQIHPADLTSLARRLGEHVASPVRFAEMVEAMYRDGARIFVEVGPGSVLSPLVDSILHDRPHLAVSLDSPSRPGVNSLLVSVAKLVVAGVPIRLDELTKGRVDLTLDLENLPRGDGHPLPSATTWLVNGSRSKPLGAAEPRRLGQGPALPKDNPVHSHKDHQNGMTHQNGTTNGRPTLPEFSTPPAINRTPASLPTSTSASSLSARSNPAEASSQPNADERVLTSFQETMRAFLDVQRSTMLAYLANRPRTTVQASAPVEPSVPQSNGQHRAEPVETLKPKNISASEKASEPTSNGVARNVAAVSAPPEKTPALNGQGTTLSRDAVANRLLEIVRDRTGYPIEMLKLDLDLEADLGIDSIKRVEILGTLRDGVPGLNGASNASTMDALSRARTLGAIVDRVFDIHSRHTANGSTTKPAAERPTSTPTTLNRTAAKPSPVRRMIIEPVDAPLSSDGDGLAPGGVVVITDDGTGVARELASSLEDRHPVIIAGTDDVDFTSPTSVEGLMDLARSSGRIAALVHALPLRKSASLPLDSRAWLSRLEPELKGLFHLARASAEDLELAAREGGGAIIAATSMGGAFASRPVLDDFFPGQGGVAGLVKTLAREWTSIRTRVVDLDPREPQRLLGQRLAAELLNDDDWIEVGYLGPRRIRLGTRVAPLSETGSPPVELAPGEPIVVTGGARGITATLTLELARKWKPTLLLLGRSPLPDSVEGPETQGITSPSDLKAAILAAHRNKGLTITPAELDRRYSSIEQAREIRANLAAFRAAGSTVEYAAVDVRDTRMLGQVLDGWRRRYGEPVGLVHGAGVIKDKLIKDKTPESFDDVLRTKLDGALNLAKLLNPRSIKFAALFSSIAGRFGNVGQSDYAAANDLLNKLALWLVKRWAGRVVSMNWGPWSGVGMVSELERHLGGKGLGMIPPDLGRTLLLNELLYGRKGEVEIIAAGELGTLDAPLQRERLMEVAR